MDESAKGTLAILAVAAAWGGTFPAMKAALASSDPLPFLAARFALAIPLLWAIAGEAPGPRSMGTGVLVFLGFALQLEGLTGTSATKSAFITGLNVPMVPAIEALLFGRKPNRRAVLGIVLGVAGLALLTGIYGGEPPSWGDLLTLACAAAWAGQVVAVDRLVGSEGPARLALGQAIPVALLAAAGSPAVGETRLPSDPVSLAAVVYTAVVATAGAFYLQGWAQSRIPPEAAALGLLAEPVFASALAAALLGEGLSAGQAVGAAMILISIPLASGGSEISGDPDPNVIGDDPDPGGGRWTA